MSLWRAFWVFLSGVVLLVVSLALIPLLGDVAKAAAAVCVLVVVVALFPLL